MKKRIWYAVTFEDTDNPDWGWGSANKREAIRMAKRWHKEDGKRVAIAIIDTSDGDNQCIGLISHDDIMKGAF